MGEAPTSLQGAVGRSHDHSIDSTGDVTSIGCHALTSMARLLRGPGTLLSVEVDAHQHSSRSKHG